MGLAEPQHPPGADLERVVTGRCPRFVARGVVAGGGPYVAQGPVVPPDGEAAHGVVRDVLVRVLRPGEGGQEPTGPGGNLEGAPGVGVGGTFDRQVLETRRRGGRVAIGVARFGGAAEQVRDGLQRGGQPRRVLGVDRRLFPLAGVHRQPRVGVGLQCHHDEVGLPDVDLKGEQLLSAVPDPGLQPDTGALEPEPGEEVPLERFRPRHGVRESRCRRERVRLQGKTPYVEPYVPRVMRGANGKADLAHRHREFVPGQHVPDGHGDLRRLRGRGLGAGRRNFPGPVADADGFRGDHSMSFTRCAFRRGGEAPGSSRRVRVPTAPGPLR